MQWLQCIQRKYLMEKNYHCVMQELALVLERRPEPMEEIKKEFSESINLTKLSNLYSQDLKIHGMNMKGCYKLLRNSIKNWKSQMVYDGSGATATRTALRELHPGPRSGADDYLAIEVDHAFQIEDSEALEIIYQLTKEEGLCLGGSSGINIAGAIALAKEMGPGHTIVTMLCDYGTRYASKIFNPEFLRQKGLPCPHWVANGGADLPQVFVE